MRVGGFQRLSLIDYPGKLSSIIFTSGCNFRCPFCYVPQLVVPEKMESIREIKTEYIFTYLRKNKKFLDAVVITGGEPTIYEHLPQFIEKIKNLDFLVGLETNGTNFKMLKKLVEEKLVNYIAMDIKTNLDFDKYKEVVGNVLTDEMFKNVKESIKFLLENKVDYEFRTTLVKEFHTKEDIVGICRTIKGARIYYLQNLKIYELGLISGKKLTSFSEEEIEEIVGEGKNFVNIVYRKE
ncbi:MAG TPA: anaerobic ribonucleoside-triphosphate reductase activating protein [Candidatus Aenigmarchaeota archaeon]|nr:anaerobic ribonucleoside-triphosphate reductase activating protein [Candidatus Aenigmarchaeota archaeon]